MTKRAAKSHFQLETTNNEIPEFYFHLIFCFLRLKEIPIIAQCSKKMRDIVMSPSFVKLFKHTESLGIHEATVISASNSIFHNLVQEISIGNTPFHLPTYLVHFPRLSKLSLTFTFIHGDIFDIRPAFKTIAPRIKELRINIHIKFDDVFPSSYVNFRNALCSFTKVSCFNIRICTPYISRYGYSGGSGRLLGLIKPLRCMLDLVHLKIPEFFLHNSQGHEGFTQLFTHPVHQKLKSIDTFHDIPYHYQEEFRRLFSALPSLESVQVVVLNQGPIPTLLGKWIKDLYIEQRTLYEPDINAIVSIGNLISISIQNCKIDNMNVQNLIRCLSSRLERLILSFANQSCAISFDLLSTCTKLKWLTITNVLGLRAESINLLEQCIHLEFVIIQNFTRDGKLELQIHGSSCFVNQLKIFGSFY
jgi:hypothetical protein